MSDAAQANISKYKAGFSSEKPSTCKTTPLKIVPGVSSEQMNALSLKSSSYTKPVDRSKK